MSTKNTPSAEAATNKATGYTFEVREGTPEYYVDGVSDAFIGIPVSKITFHTVRGVSSTGMEDRASVITLAISTAALFEMCRNMLAQGIVAADQIHGGFDTTRDQVKDVLSGIAVEPVKRTGS